MNARNIQGNKAKNRIEQLEGKYKHLPIQQVIAVSKSGFYETAYRRAELGKVKLLTLKEALTEDWPKKLANYGMGFVCWYFSLESAVIEYHSNSFPILDNETLYEAKITNQERTVESTFGSEFVKLYKTQGEKDAKNWVEENMKQLWKGTDKFWAITSKWGP